MDCYGRRNRRGRPRSRATNLPPHTVPRPSEYSVFSSFFNFLILCSLIAIIFLILEYHCNICSKKGDLMNITKGIDDIAYNISTLKHSYYDLEKTVMKFSEDIPKIAGQVEILETIAKSMEKGDFGWNPKTKLALPNVDVFLNTPESIIPNELSINETKKIGKLTEFQND